MDELENQLEELNRAFDQLNRGLPLTAEQMELVRRAQEQLEDSTLDLKDVFKSIVKGAIQVADGFLETADAARNARDKFASLDGIINAVGKSVPLVGDGLAAAGTYMTKSLDQVVEAFNTAGQVGAIGASGLDGFNDSVKASKIGLAGFSQAVSRNSQSLAFALGNTRAGAEAFADAVGDDALFKRLSALGFTQQEQADFAAEALAEDRRLGISQKRSTTDIINLTGSYAERISTLSRLTGLQSDQVKAALDASQRDARVRAAMAAATAEFGPEVGQAVKDTVSAIRGLAGGDAIAEGFGDLLFNAGSEAAANLQVITGGAAEDIAQRLKRGEITQGVATEELVTSIRGYVDQIGGPAALGQLSKLGTLFDSFGVEIFEVMQRSGMTAEQIEALRKETKDAAEAEGDLNDQVRDAQVSLRNFAAEVDKFVLNTMLPLSAKMTKVMTDGLDKVMSKINELFGDDAIQTGQVDVQANGDVIVNGVRHQAGSAVAVQEQGIQLQADTIPGAAEGGPVPSGQLTMVGELGPELIRPQTASNVTTAEDVQALVDTARSSLAGIPQMTEGLRQVFMPGIGTATSYSAGGMESLKIENMDGLITELKNFNIPGLTSQTKITSGNRTFTKSSMPGGYTYAPTQPGEAYGQIEGMKQIGGYDINTDLKQTGGPRSMYDSMMEQFQQDTAQIRTFTQRGGTPDQIATPDLNDPEVKQLLKTIAASMRQVETGIGKQNRTSDDILRATTG